MTEPPDADDRPQPIRTYTDEYGRTVRVYPPRYAEGAWTQAVTVRPSVRRGPRE
jgi:hypothetical protein